MNIDWTQGWLSIDDCLIEKPYAKKIESVYCQYSSKINDFEQGLNITVLTWSNGKIIVPVCFMVYEKDEKGEIIETKNEFALRAIEYAYKKGIKPKWINFDSKYSASKLLNRINIYEAKLNFQQKFMGRKINGDKALRLLIA